MGKFTEFYKARDFIKQVVFEDLVGPVFDDEVINEVPTSYYIMGKLYPKTDYDSQEENDEKITGIDLDAYDCGNSLATANMKEPQAMGITYTVVPNCKEIKIEIEYAFYIPYSLEEAQRENIDLARYQKLINEASEKEKRKMMFWKRKFSNETRIVSAEDNSDIEITDNVFLHTFVHMKTEDGCKIITSVLTNERKVSGTDRTATAQNTLCQVNMKISSNDNETYIFTEVGRQVEMTDNDELLQLEMLYLNDKCYAQGHGCSVVWDTENKYPTYIKSEFMPEYNLLQMKAKEIDNNPVFNMKYLFSAEKEAVITNLRNFIDLYKQWIEKAWDTSKADEYKNYSMSVEQNLNSCEKVCKRILHSIDLLDMDNNAWIAFKYANEAMFMQRYQSILKQVSNNISIDESKINWYPFQLAFFLLEIASFVEPDSEDRKLVDLLWFPTGGGKTEAYLGIAAFEIFYRRLCNPDNCDGLTIIMRYTLRLLTIQQFERASMLICACEILRKKYSIPGSEISIGLWVGNNFTPGTVASADEVLTKIMVITEKGLNGEDVNPCQIKACPWCGKMLYPKDYTVKSSIKRMEIRCSNNDCHFNEVPLPVRLIDEEIYEYKPTFLVATVDKFAQIAIQEKIAPLFAFDSELLPPELIIQDELHLISGPLGTMTGIYEAAITNICEKKGRPVKIVASTATIRNASKQILALYGRNYNQFPPQGLDASDSFFAIKSSIDEKPARLYSGIMGVGTTFTTTLIRLYAAWLYASRYLIDLGYDEGVIDNYWTLTGYFNSIRELGATQTQIVDDIQSRYRYLKENKFQSKYPKYSGKEKYENVVELTSRMSNDELSDVIQNRLKKPYNNDGNEEVYDFVLASNMISVGVDVSRLGTMAVAGQSKTNAEYIQATSRVGRSNPGLVFTVYNAMRSRDRSHYEQFSRYHSALYRYVEATSLTPFSDRARDRGLQALFVILCRYYCPELLPDNAAGKFSIDLPGVKQVEQLIYRYVNVVDMRERDKVLAEIKDIENKWEQMTLVGELWYRKKGKPSLLKEDIEEDRFRIMNSMRTVESESGIWLVGEYE